jgi:hypothetical protein
MESCCGPGDPDVASIPPVLVPMLPVHTASEYEVHVPSQRFPLGPKGGTSHSCRADTLTRPPVVTPSMGLPPGFEDLLPDFLA